MTRKIKNNLPKHQSVCFNDKVLWELIRITAQNADLSISELVETGIRFFFTHPDKEKIIARAKLNKELGHNE